MTQHEDMSLGLRNSGITVGKRLSEASGEECYRGTWYTYSTVWAEPYNKEHGQSMSQVIAFWAMHLSECCVYIKSNTYVS